MRKKTIHPFWRFASIATLGRLRTRVLTSKKRIYLTFDDGPHPEHTPVLLDLLQSYRAQATFFLIGSECLNHADIVERISQAGHRLGNHSATHPSFHRLPPISQWREYSRADEVLSNVSQRSSGQFSIRPPRGAVTWTSLVYSFARCRRLVLWSRDSLDSSLASDEVCEEFESLPVKNGDVLLFHDDSRVCIDALRKLLPRWKQQGFRFVA
jgi:peptidoglycan-N-acetylglucosamine deacetylase